MKKEKVLVGHPEVLGSGGVALFKSLSALLGGEYYLAGGTGLALQAGHRKSVDLDFFRSLSSLVIPGKEKLKLRLRKVGRYQLISEDEGSILAKINGIKVSILAYRAKNLHKEVSWMGGWLADPLDIGLMKLSAIINRGAKKDFIDMAYIIRENYSLPILLQNLPKKYPDSADMAVTAMKALTYFNDAEKEPDPIILKGEYSWTSARSIITFAVKEAVKRWSGRL